MRAIGKRLVLGASVVLLAVSGIVVGGETAHTYVGIKKCNMCHKQAKKGNQMAQWKQSKHANAFAVLATPEAKKVAKEKGIDNPQTSDKCLKCHVTAFGKPAAQIAETFNKEDGIQCETCHGAGSAYKKNKIMKSLEKSIANGLVMPTREVCVTCHNQENPNFKGFCFAHSYAKIAHPNPNTKSEARTIKCTCDKKEDLQIDETGKTSFIKQAMAPSTGKKLIVSAAP